MRTRSYTSFTMALLTIPTILVWGGCSKKSLAPGAGSQSQAQNSGPSSDQVATASASFNGTAGIMNVNQVFRSMTYVTGVSPTAQIQTPAGGMQSLSAQYQAIGPFLSATGGAGTLKSSMLLSITGMAGSVCNAFLSNEAQAEATLAGSSLADQGVPFAGGPSSLTSAVAATIIKSYANRFWGRAPTSDELATLSQAISDAAQETTAAGSAGVQQVLLVPCTAILSSLAFLAA